MLKKRGTKMHFMIAIIGLIVIGAITLVAGDFLSQINNRKSQLAEYILANRETAAVVAYTFDENGELIDDRCSLFYNADTPLVVGSIIKSVVLAAYADTVIQGELDPNERILITDLESYYLPMTDGGAHVEGLASLGLKAESTGFATDQTAKVSLDDIARIMIDYSGNAETDYLIARLGKDKIASMISVAGLKQHTPISSILGLTLALFNHENPLIEPEQRHALITTTSAGDFNYPEHLMDLYLHDQEWRTAQIGFMQSSKFTEVAGKIAWDGQVEASQMFPKGTAREYAHFMAEIASGQFISAEVSARMQKKLEGAAAYWPLRLLYFDRFGAKDGATAGVLTLASYAVPKNGPLAGQARIVVVFTNKLPFETWQEQYKNEGIYLLQTDIARALGVFGRLVDPN
jgi:D-alanyl-D-alanine carboxypeptidase